MTQLRAGYLDGPVAIIGAGIGGLTAALSLQHFGVPVRVFEQARALREIGAGVTITPNVLDFLGLGPALAEQAGETPRYFARSAADGGELERGPDPMSFVPDFGAPYCNLHRADLHAALTGAVTNNDVPRSVIADPYALYVGVGRSLIHYPLRRLATMNVLGNAQASHTSTARWFTRTAGTGSVPSQHHTPT